MFKLTNSSIFFADYDGKGDMSQVYVQVKESLGHNRFSLFLQEASIIPYSFNNEYYYQYVYQIVADNKLAGSIVRTENSVCISFYKNHLCELDFTPSLVKVTDKRESVMAS
ncbi:hypothetical protein [Ectobacillus sp. sgz5001026]|uniref:hypothetical protein n=1 Tax=Ectobacillus sp. sgz5001026 TaxID=3242473 RepID=UPI0036D29D5D